MSRQQYAKAKGRSWEQDVVDWLRRDHAIPAERRRQTGADDCGDVGAWQHVVIEAKACKAITLAAFMDECAAETENAMTRFGGPQYGFVMAKRRGCKRPSEGYAILPPDLAVAALKALLDKAPSVMLEQRASQGGAT